LVAVIVTEQVVAVPEHAPDQPEKVAVPGCSVNVTGVPSVYVAEQVPDPAEQLIPPTSDVTDPFPVTDTVSVYVGFNANVAVTLFAAVIVTTHVPVPEHPPPDQPENVESGLADADNVTVVPSA